MTRVALLMLATVLLSACSSNPIEPSYYLLRPSGQLETRQMSPSSEFALGKITIAPYLDQQGLLLQTSEGQIRPAQHHLWAEPMYEGIHAFLVKEISRAKGEDILPSRLGQEATVVEVRIDELHGTADGRARLTAYWWLRRDREILSAHQFSESRPLDREGYAALVDAERALLAQLAEKIAASMVAPG